MFSSSDIKWLKNVKREGGAAWAYMEYDAGDTFNLNWRKDYKKNAGRPKVGDVILLFQTVIKTNNISAGTYLTHLVTPLDEIVNEEISSHPFTRRVGVIAKPENPISTKSLSFTVYKASRGACCNIDLITLKDKSIKTEAQKQLLVWGTFTNKKENLLNFFNLIGNIQEEDEGCLEGKQREELRKHKFYERNPEIVKQAKEKARVENRLKCEVCKFDFKLFYPLIGEGFIECHHKQPISKGGERKTKIDDLALVCSNCHRMLHKTYKGSFLSVERLKEIINNI